jgi:hypothetical protein
MCAEMAGAMFVPAVAAVVLFWCSVIHSGAVGAVEMNAMLPAMIAVMLLRRREYSPWPTPEAAQARVLGIQRNLYKWASTDHDQRFSVT